jgi:hypothetical protein
VLKIPLKILRTKAKFLAPGPDPALETAAVNAKYVFSEYHRCGPDGRPAKKRTKPASHCPRQWTKQEALNALRAAIRKGHVSQNRTSDGFPRRVWHKEGETWYEATTQDRAGGFYHGYPIEEIQLPNGLRK